MKDTGSFQLRCWHVDIAGLTCCVALTVLGFVVVVSPIKAEQQRLTTLRQELGTLRAQAGSMEERQTLVHDELTRIREQLAERPVKLDPPSRLNNRLADIVSVATGSELLIDQTQSGEVRGGHWFDTVEVRLSGQGTFPDWTRFLYRLHAKLPDVGVDGFEIVGHPGNPGARSNFDMSLTWYAAGSVAAAD